MEEDARRERGRNDRLTIAALVFLVYLACANIGHALSPSVGPTLIWPALGIALAAAYFGGMETLGAIFLAEFVFTFFVAASPLFVALGLAVADTVQVAVGVYFLRRFEFHTGIARLRDAYILIAVAVLTALIAPIMGSATIAAAGTMSGAMLRTNFGNWYVGDLFSLIVLAPLLLRWLPKPKFKRSDRDWIEIGCAVGAVVALSALIFISPYGDIGGVPLIYILLLPLFWIGLRLGPRIMTAAVALLAFVSVIGTLGRVPASLLPSELFSIELLISVLAIIFLLLVGVAEERKDATKTLHKQLERLEVALEEIRDEDKTKNEFIALLAHELRNPLAPLLSSLELMRLEESSPGTRSAINAMRGRVRTMGRLLDDLLDLSRIEHRTLSLMIERVDLVAIAKRAIETTEARLAEKHQVLVASLPTEPIDVAADPVRIEQVIVNLLTNANKYSAEDGVIKISLGRERGNALISVKDTGAGIAPEMKARIFEPFQQGEPGKRAGGLGIGLALSKNLVEMHGGTIEATSAGVGRGSEFVVRLPIGAPSGARSGTERERQLKKLDPSKPLPLLIVDDNRAAADSMAALLIHVGHKPKVAYDGASGIKAAKRSAYAVIILDIGLPDMSGYDVARTLRDAGIAATLIAVTGYGQEEDKKKAMEAGFDFHLTKPVSLVDMEKVLRSVAEKKPTGPRGR